MGNFNDVNPNQKCLNLLEDYKKLIYALTGVFLLKIFIMGVSDLFNDVLMVCLLFMSVYSYSYMWIGFALFFVVFNLVFYVYDAFLVVQNYFFGFYKGWSVLILMVVKCAEICLCFFIIKVGFELYKEYKFISFDDASASEYQRINESGGDFEGGSQQFQAFKGKGYLVG